MLMRRRMCRTAIVGRIVISMALMADAVEGRTTHRDNDGVVEPIRLPFAVVSTLSSWRGKGERISAADEEPAAVVRWIVVTQWQ